MGVINYLKELNEKHERLKKRIHSFRIPLSPAGRRFMGLVYFSIPVLLGYYIMQVAIDQSKHNLGENNEKLKIYFPNEQTKQNNKALQIVLDKIKKKHDDDNYKSNN